MPHRRDDQILRRPREAAVCRRRHPGPQMRHQRADAHHPRPAAVRRPQRPAQLAAVEARPHHLRPVSDRHLCYLSRSHFGRQHPDPDLRLHHPLHRRRRAHGLVSAGRGLCRLHRRALGPHLGQAPHVCVRDDSADRFFGLGRRIAPQYSEHDCVARLPRHCDSAV